MRLSSPNLSLIKWYICPSMFTRRSAIVRPLGTFLGINHFNTSILTHRCVFSYWVSSRATKIRVSTGYVHDCIDGTTYNCVYSVSKRDSGIYYICIYSRIYFISIYYLNTYTPTHRFEASVAPKSPKLLPVTHFRYACRQRIQNMVTSSTTLKWVKCSLLFNWINHD